MALDLISICIPTWEQHGYGRKYLRKLFDSIKSQTYKNYEVIVSDHSINNGIKDLVDEYQNYFKIIYFKNENKRGNGPANTNKTIKLANGNIIKIVFQDDFFFDNESLQKIKNRFEETNCKWLVNGCNHTNDGINFNREMVPSWNNKILEGVNTISSPSVLSFLNEEPIFFDENLVMLMDCEYYYSLYKKHGLPEIINDTLITNRIHQHQISAMYDKSLNEEINYAKNKHK